MQRARHRLRLEPTRQLDPPIIRDRRVVDGPEIDLDSTYVAGSPELMTSLAAQDHLGAPRTAVSAGITFDIDGINPLPDKNAR